MQISHEINPASGSTMSMNFDFGASSKSPQIAQRDFDFGVPRVPCSLFLLHISSVITGATGVCYGCSEGERIEGALVAMRPLAFTAHGA